MSENQKKKNEFEKNYKLYDSDSFFKKPLVKIVVGTGITFLALYISKYFVNAGAETVRAYKNFRNAIKE